MSPRHAGLLARLACWQATSAAVLVHVDLRHMRSINRLSGPDCGDQLLRRVLQQMRAWAGPDGIAEHVRSNEFVGIKPIDHAQAAADEAAALRQRLVDLSYASPMGKSHAAVAIGLQLARPGADWPRLLAEAAEACQRAKQRGVNQISTPAVLFDEGAAEPVHASRVAAFRELQANGRLRLYPQPIMDIRGATPRLAKAEFLIRMQDGGSAVP
ncbi:MAG TPA: GGDEF domain-containing protein, partial [Solimonas sp.]|nr:GGDEF domain-containing protein [Solimonas sp.]